MKTFLTLIIFLGLTSIVAMYWTSGKPIEALAAPAQENVAANPEVGMGEVVAIRHLTLKNDVDPNVFEKFIAEQYSPAFRQHLPGIQAWIAKGERGTNVGKYVLIWYIDSIHTRNLYFPPPSSQGSEIFQTVWQASDGLLQQVQDKLALYVNGLDEYTDYVVLQ
jgi:hypothetical protein